MIQGVSSEFLLDFFERIICAAYQTTNIIMVFPWN